MSNYTDRELLELAAEAAGIDCEWNENFGKSGMMMLRNPPTYRLCFDPINDDGDAFRLALNLRIKFERHPIQPFVAAFSPNIVGRCEEPEEMCVNSATRRSIVRLAAMMGEMKRQEQE